MELQFNVETIRGHNILFPMFRGVAIILLCSHHYLVYTALPTFDCLFLSNRHDGLW